MAFSWETFVEPPLSLEVLGTLEPLSVEPSPLLEAPSPESTETTSVAADALEAFSVASPSVGRAAGGGGGPYP